jgi:hypothetical protein
MKSINMDAKIHVANVQSGWIRWLHDHQKVGPWSHHGHKRINAII